MSLPQSVDFPEADTYTERPPAWKVRHFDGSIESAVALLDLCPEGEHKTTLSTDKKTYRSRFHVNKYDGDVWPGQYLMVRDDGFTQEHLIVSEEQLKRLYMRTAIGE